MEVQNANYMASVILSTFNIFLMQLGFCMLEVGAVRIRNESSILVKNLQGACVSAMAYWFLGYALAYGPGSSDNSYLFSGAQGKYGLFLSGVQGSEKGLWVMHYVFAASCTSIVSGAVAERCSIGAFLAYAAVMSTICYPIISCWLWNEKGWLSAYNPDAFLGGVIDCAGCAVVHITGGYVALIFACVVGPRDGRFDGGKPVYFRANSNSLRTIGVFILWFGWYSFNSTSGGHIGSDSTMNIAMTTTISATSCGFLSLVIKRFVSQNEDEARWELDATLNGILAGLVSITACCGVVESWAAFLIGALGAPVWMGSKYLVEKYGIDDVVDAAAIHLGCGIWGILASALFAEGHLVAAFYGPASKVSNGLFCPDSKSGALILASIVAILCVILWCTLIFAPFLYVGHRYNLLRVNFSNRKNKEIELSGRNHGENWMQVASDDGKAETNPNEYVHDLNPQFVRQWVNMQDKKDSIDKAVLITLAFSKGAKELVALLLLFDKFSGGSYAIVGPTFEIFMEKLTKTYEPFRTVSNTESSSPTLTL